MRKCDICDTPIPVGQKRCPRCGLVYKPDVKINGMSKARTAAKSEYMSQFKQHDFEEQKTIDTKEYMKQFKLHPFSNTVSKSTRSRVSNSQDIYRKKGLLRKLIRIIIILISISILISGGIIYRFSENFEFFDIEEVFSDFDLGELFSSFIPKETNIYDSLDALSVDFPQIALDIEDKVEKAKSFLPDAQMDFSSEEYVVKGDELEHVQICDSNYYNDYDEHYTTCYDDSWYTLMAINIFDGDNFSTDKKYSVYEAMASLLNMDEKMFTYNLERVYLSALSSDDGYAGAFNEQMRLEVTTVDGVVSISVQNTIE